MNDLDDEWKRLEALIRINFGVQRPYIAAHKKRKALGQLSDVKKNSGPVDPLSHAHRQSLKTVLRLLIALLQRCPAEIPPTSALSPSAAEPLISGRRLERLRRLK